MRDQRQASLSRHEEDGDAGMIEEPRTDAGNVGDELDAEPRDLVRGADAAAEEDARCRNGTRGEDDAIGEEIADASVVLVLHADRASVPDEDSPDVRIRDELEVAPGADRLAEVGAR